MIDIVTHTTAGPVRGRTCGQVRRFFGVPYAQAPVGERRFAKPVDPRPWTEPLDATEFGPAAPQIVREFPALDLGPLIGGGASDGDAYLNANIWTAEGAANAPVMVFVHGGAFRAGSNRAAAYDGTAFARSGVVLISVNYRLGVEGFAAVKGVPDNIALRDLLQALRWVRANAAAFGGDPERVTVFGESAGAMLVADLLGSPAAAGLFRRAIIQSGHAGMVQSEDVARRATERVARALKITPDLPGFRSRSAAECAAALEALSLPTARFDVRDANGFDPTAGLSRVLPVVGDEVLPQPPLQAVRNGGGREVDLLIGTNAEEMNIYLVPTGVKAKLKGWMAWLVLSRTIRRARAVLKAYGLGRRAAGEVMADALGDLVFRAPARRLAAAHQGRTWMYEFDWRSPQFDGALGACHGLELPFVFDTLDSCRADNGLLGPDGGPQALADRMHRLWVDFARDGDLPWAQYDGENRAVRRLWADETVREAPPPADDFLP